MKKPMTVGEMVAWLSKKPQEHPLSWCGVSEHDEGIGGFFYAEEQDANDEIIEGEITLTLGDEGDSDG